MVEEDATGDGVYQRNRFRPALARSLQRTGVVRQLAIVNPRSRRGEHLEGTIRDHFGSDTSSRVESTEYQGHAAELAKRASEEGFERVVAVGGDGTVHEVVNGLREGGEGVSLAVLPVGTGNDFARSLGMPLDLEGALAALERGRTRDIDLVLARGADGRRRLANMAAGGFGGEVHEHVTAELKESWGPFAFFRAALERLPERAAYEVEIVDPDGTPFVEKALNVAVANGRFVAGGIPAAPYAELDDGLLDVVLVKDCGLVALTSLAPRVLLGRHLEDADECILFLQARRLVVRADRPLPWNLDGEPFVSGDLSFEVEPGALEVVVGEEEPAQR